MSGKLSSFFVGFSMAAPMAAPISAVCLVVAIFLQYMTPGTSGRVCR